MLNILIVDDNDTNLILLEMYLKDLNCRLYKAHNGQEAWEKVLRLKFDAILLDYQMPLLNGGELLDRLREVDILSNTFVIMVTCCSEYNLRKTLINKGAKEVLVKPVLQEIVVNTLQRYLPYLN